MKTQNCFLNTNQTYLLPLQLQTFILFTYGEMEKRKEKSEGVVIGLEDHKNYIEFGEYLKLQKEKEELEKEVERLQKVLYTITGSRDDGEPDLYEDVEGDLC